ncbi:N-alpha-acetyltransferase 30A-like [Bactrocera neohumeralis]|uniref:N-alpha-acetyltransferase 30A-like n=1 Tax=Bactrocera neohumeralis TaxID=98809 RepID=UPI0021662F9D|nr:N-alpha-acetyltransferase 30A-like [Bactrocera neohumeralis]
MDNTASAIVEQQKLATTQKSKKRQKSKKANGKVPNSSAPNDLPDVAKDIEKVTVVSGAEEVTANGISETLKQHLHITGDGLQINGTVGKCSSHTAQNGHHTPATNITHSSARTAIVKTQQQQSALQEITTSGALKKSKSKNNKQKNKEANFEIENHKSSQTSHNSNGESPALTYTSPMEETRKPTEVDNVQLKNGFHDFTNEQDEALHSKETQQQCVVNAEITKPITNNTEPNILKSAAARGVAATAAVSISGTCPQHKQLPTPTVAQPNTIYANPPTAIHNTNNTAKQHPDDAQQTDQTNPKEAPLSVSTTPALAVTTELDLSNVQIEYKEYESELQMHDIMRLIQAELSEPYSIYTYRYFIYNWPKLCFLAAHGNEYIGAIVCKLDMHRNVRRGYIAMLAVRKEYRKLKIGTTLVQKAIEAMLADNADEVVLETEMRNVPALRLYENLGFVRDKRLFRYYLNGVDALRLKLWFR